MTSREYHIDITETGITALDILVKETALPKATIKLAMERGAVWLGKNNKAKRLRRGKKIITTGEQLHLYFNEAILLAEPLTPSLIDDQGEYSIWNKPYGMYCQGSKWADHFTLNRWIESHHSRASWIVHRLDRATSGLIIIGHSKKTTAALAALFQARAVEKIYQAIVYGCFPDNKSITINTPINGKEARSHIIRLGYDAANHCSQLEVTIDTGRKHQIRRHLSEAGFPIIGDRLYGERQEDHQQPQHREQKHSEQINLQLCCTSLGFICPLTGQQKQYRIDAPASSYSNS